MIGKLRRLGKIIAHKFNWHYAPKEYVDDKEMRWCQWCGFKEITDPKKGLMN